MHDSLGQSREASAEAFGDARRAIVAGVALLAIAACGGPGNIGQSTPDPSLIREVPWLNGVQPALDTGGAAVIPSIPVYPQIGLGLAGTESGPVDCSQLKGLEFSTGWTDTFEPPSATDLSETGIGAGWSSYDDLTQYSLHTPGDATWYPGLQGTYAAPWGLPADRTAGPLCDGKANDWALHFRGGLFRRWGAGFSHALTDPAGRYRGSPSDACPAGIDFCPPPVAAGAAIDTAGLPLKAASGQDYLQPHDFFDVSAYEGIAFWARRGPDGQDSVTLILTDKFTSDRLARQNETFCRRLRECHTHCLNEAPCSPENPSSPTPTYRCFDPKAGPLPSNITIESLLDLMYPRCGPICTSPSTYLDPDFDGKACRPYTFPAADVSGEYCWNEGDPPPPSRDESCQDGWKSTVQLSTDWKFYGVPFSDLQQSGFGKPAPYLDLHSIDVVAFGSAIGWVDLYVDNITFYRHKK